MAGISGALAYDPGQLAGLNPGANNSGMPGSTLGPMSTTGVLGGSAGNPMIPSMPNGQGVNTAAPMPAGSTDPYATSGATSALAGLGAPGGGNPNTGSNQFGYTGTDLAKSIQASGVKGGAGTALAQFLNTGAGFNPQVAQALIAAMQPQFAKGQANLMEQFGASGQAAGSSAALAMGDYMAQENLDVGQLLSGMYEQSVSNYMNVLTGMKNTPKQPFWEQLLNTAVGDVSATAKV
jgi:hypothetical protein